MQKSRLDAYVGGAEANVAVALSNWGCEVNFVTHVPQNQVAKGAVRQLQSYGVGTSNIVYHGERIGTYYTETGANQRPSAVIYDRAGSAFSTAKPVHIDWCAVLDGSSWLHFTGITPAVSRAAAANMLEALVCAKNLGITISCDLNYRAKLWNYGCSPKEIMPELFSYVDVAIANDFDCINCLGIDFDDNLDNLEGVDRFLTYSTVLSKQFPNIKTHVATNRQALSADSNNWSAWMRRAGKVSVSRVYPINDIVDRIGSGDSFAAGLLYGLNHFDNDQAVIEYAAAAGCLKHAYPGDFSLTEVDDVLALVEGHSDGRIKR